MSDWAPFGPPTEDDPAPKPSPVPAEEPVEEPGSPPEPIELPRRDPEPDLPPAAAFAPPAPPPLEPLPGPAPPLAWPAPRPQQQEAPPVGTWPPPGPPAYGTPRRIAGNATASLVLGIVGLVMCPIIPSIAAISLGMSAKREIRSTPGLGGETLASWGIGLGVVGLAFGIILIAVVVGGSLSV